MKKTLIALFLVVGMIAAMAVPAFASEKNGDGVLIYQENFDAYADQPDSNKALEQIGWVAQTKEDAAYSNPTATLTISGGRLEVLNTGNDSYYLMLTEEDMAAYTGETITIQYDVEYTTASNSSRYLCILANYNGQNYNSFHFRNRGDGNNQAHVSGSWKTYDAIDVTTDVFAAGDDASKGTSIAMRLLGQKFSANTMAFSGVPVTIRYVLHATDGPSVYMKLADDPESAFVCVSAPDVNADLSVYNSWAANAICFKVGGAQNGYVDNIAVWTGDGNFPQPEPEVEETTVAESDPTEPSEDTPAEGESDGADEGETKPEKVKEPHTIVNKIAICALALFGGLVIVKKGKERS